MAVKYDLYENGIKVAADINTGYEYDKLGDETVHNYHVESYNSVGDADDSNVNSGWAADDVFLTLTWDNPIVDLLFYFNGPMTYSTDGGVTTTVIPADTNAVLPTGSGGPYILRETTFGGVTHLQQARAYASGSNVSMTASNGKLLSANRLFDYLSMVVNLNITDLNTNDITDMGFMFNECRNLSSIDLSNMDTTGVTDMSYMFNQCHELTSIDVSGFDTSLVTNTMNMFATCLNVNDLDLTDFGSNNLINGFSMFDRSGITTLNLTNAVIGGDHIFNNFDSIIHLDMTNFNVGSGRSALVDFSDCINLEDINLTGCSSGADTDLGFIFDGAESLIDINMTDFNATAVTTVCQMFRIRTTNSIKYINFTNWNIPLVNDMHEMFYGCSNLICLTNLNTTAVDELKRSYLFRDCSSLIQPDATTQADLTDTNGANWANTNNCGPHSPPPPPPPPPPTLSITWDTQSADTKVTVSGSMHYTNNGGSTWSNITGSKQTLLSGVGPYELKEPSPGAVGICKFDDSLGSNGFNGNMQVTNGTLTSTHLMFLQLDNLVSLDLTGFDTTNVTDMSNMFQFCSGLTTLDLTPLDTTSVTNMGYMFEGCSGLTTLDLTPLDTSQVTNMQTMFTGCSGLTTLNITPLNTSKVTNMSTMFTGCSGLTSLHISSMDTSSVTDMTSLFGYCSGLITIDLTSFNTTAVTIIHGMFYKCTGLSSLDISPLDTSSVTNMGSLFAGCSGLTSLDLTTLNTTVVSNTSNMFSSCTNLACITNINTIASTNKHGMFNNIPTLIQPDGWNSDPSLYTGACADITDIDGANWVNPGSCP